MGWKRGFGKYVHLRPKVGTCVRQFSNLLTLNEIIFQSAFWCRYSVNNMHANVLVKKVPTRTGPRCAPSACNPR